MNPRRSQAQSRPTYFLRSRSSNTHHENAAQGLHFPPRTTRRMASYSDGESCLSSDDEILSDSDDAQIAEQLTGTRGHPRTSPAHAASTVSMPRHIGDVDLESPLSSSFSTAPSSPLLSGDTPTHAYSGVQLAVRSPSQSLQLIRLYFHRSWEVTGQAVILHLQDGQVQRLTRDIDVPSTLTKIHQPVALFQSPAHIWSLTTAWSIITTIIKYIIYPFIIALILFLLFQPHASYIPLPLHHPLISLAEHIDPKLNPVLQPARTRLNRFSSSVSEICSCPRNWKNAHEQDASENGGLLKRFIWSTGDNGEGSCQLPGASDDEMEGMADACGIVENTSKDLLVKIGEIEANISEHTWPMWINFLGFLTQELESLPKDTTTSQPLILQAYRRALQHTQERMTIIQRQVRDYQDDPSGRGKAHDRRNPHAWRVEKTPKLVQKTIHGSFDEVLEGLEIMDTIRTESEHQMEVLVNSTKIYGRPADKELLKDLESLDDAFRYLESFRRGIRRELGRIEALKTISDYISPFDQVESNASSDWTGDDFWTALWTFFGMFHEMDTSTPRASLIIRLRAVGTRVLPLILRPQPPIQLPSTSIQLTSLSRTHQRLSKLRLADLWTKQD